MKRFAPIFLMLALLLVCRTPVSAEEHEHMWSLDDYEKYNDAQHKVVRECYDCGYRDVRYENHDWTRETFMDREGNDTHHYAYYKCYDCGATKDVLEKHKLNSTPNYYEYGTDAICYAVYICRTCQHEIEVPEKHNFKIYPTNLPKSIGTDFHQLHSHKKCTKCNYEYIGFPLEKHNLGFHKTTYKGKPAIYWGCDICDYNYDGYVYPKNRTDKVSVKLNHYLIRNMPLPHTDKIKSIKVTSGKSRVKVKKLSYNKIRITPKKKGTAKFKTKTKAGITFVTTVKVK